MAVEIFMWTVSEDLCVYEIVNRADSAVIVSSWVFVCAQQKVLSCDEETAHFHNGF